MSSPFPSVTPTEPLIVKVVIIDDHAAIIEMMTQVVESLPNFRVVGSALDAASAMTLCRSQSMDIIILDLVLPGVSGLALLNDLKALHPEARVLIFTGSLNEPAMRGALAAGVLGVVEKMASLDVFRAALQAVAADQPYYGPLAGRLIKSIVSRDPEDKTGGAELTKREKTILCLVAQGLSSKEIAGKLGVSVHTVINHRTNLMKKTGLRRVAQLSLYAAQSGLIGETSQPDGATA